MNHSESNDEISRCQVFPKKIGVVPLSREPQLLVMEIEVIPLSRESQLLVT